MSKLEVIITLRTKNGWITWKSYDVGWRGNDPWDWTAFYTWLGFTKHTY